MFRESELSRVSPLRFSPQQQQSVFVLDASAPPPAASQPTEAEERRDEDSERHQDGEHQAAVVGGVRVRCSGARLDPGLGNGLGPFLPAFLASFAVLLLFLFFLGFLQARVRLQLWHICQGKEEPGYSGTAQGSTRLPKPALSPGQ